MRKLFWSLLIGSVMFTTGCGDKAASSPAAPAKSDSTQPTGAASGANVVQPETAPSSGVAQQTPAVQVAPPDEIVALFFDSMRRGDEATTSSLLTTKAREELAKNELAVQPPGSPEATYQVGRVEYFDDDKDAAFVHSVLNEPVGGGAPPKPWEIVWALHRETPGWRIAGFAVEVSEAEAPVVVDFENGADTKSKVEGVQTGAADPVAAAGQVPGQQTGAQQTGVQQPGAQLPTFNLPPTQIASPPQQGGGIQR